MFTWYGLYVVSFEIPIGMLCAIYVGIDVLLYMFWGQLAGSSILHLMGAVLGGIVGIVMLKCGMVDCEGWDVFSRLKGKNITGQVPEPTEEQAEMLKRSKEAKGKQQFIAAIQANEAPAALVVCRRMEHLGTPLELGRKELLALIVGLHKHERWADSAPLMAEFLRRFPEDSAAMRVKLAQVCLLKLERPAKALELLKPLQADQLSAAEKQLVRKLAARAQQLIKAGELEFDDGAW